MAADLEGNTRKLRTRSPAYPYLDLRSALDKAATLWKAEGRHPAVVNVVMHHWGYKEDSSTGYSCMAALKKYGLIEHDGMGENKQIRLSDLAQAILLDENSDPARRAEALRTAALGPRIHAELWERYGSDLPSDQSLKRFLVLEKSFNEAVVDELLAEYKQTINFAGLNLVPAPGVAAGAFTPVAGGSAAGGIEVYPAAAGAAVPRGRHAGAAAPAAEPEELPYDWRQEAAPAAFQAPPRAVGRREAPEASTGPERRREPSVHGIPARYGQDDFGYDDDGYTDAPRANHPARVQPEPIALSTREPARSTPRTVPAPMTVTPPAGMAALTGVGEGDPSSEGPRKELPVPLDGDRVVLVPYPMTEEDFGLLIATLQLWKKRLVRGGE